MGVHRLTAGTERSAGTARWNLRRGSAGPAGDRWFAAGTTALAAAAVAMLAGIVLLLAIYAWPALTSTPLRLTGWKPTCSARIR